MDATRVIPSLAATDRWSAIDALIDQLVVSGQLAPQDCKGVTEAVYRREKSRSTGIGSGLAIPHARTPLVQEFAWCFGRARQGIPFDAFDNQPVYFIFLFLVPEAQFERHVQVLARITRVFRGDQVLHDLEIAPDAAAIARILGSRL